MTVFKDCGPPRDTIAVETSVTRMRSALIPGWEAPPFARRTGVKLARAAVLFGVIATMACNSGDSAPADTSGTAEAASDSDHAGEPAEGVVKLDTLSIRLGGIEVGAADSISSAELRVTGSITYDANRVSHIGSRTNGRIVSMRADLGERVGRGQVLAILESADVGKIRAEEREAEELVKISQENYSREQRLAEQGISSRKELLVAEAELRRNEAASRSAEERLRVLGAGHGAGGQFGIAAPFAGIVAARDASLGEMAEPTDILFTVADLSRVWIELDVFERDLARVRAGQPVSVTVTAYPDREFPARIVYVGDVLNPEKRTAQARVEIPNPEGVLKPGMFATASIRTGSGGAVAVVPQEAIQEFEGRTVVFVPGDEAGEFRASPVELGETLDGNRVVIRSGIAPGGRIVVAGAFALRSELAKGEIGEHGH